MLEILGRGSTRHEALIDASRRLMNTIIDAAPFGSFEERAFQASGPDETGRIVNWLNEIVFFFDTEGMVFNDFTIDSWTEAEITGRARGELIDLSRHDYRAGVKNASAARLESHAVP